MGLIDAGRAARLDRYIGYYEPYATSHDVLDRDTAIMEEVRNAARAVVVITAGGLLFSLPFTWAGGGGPPGNRYFLSLYPLLLFLTPPLRSLWPALVAWTGGALFTAHVLINPFVSSAKPWVHPQRGLLRLLPVEMTMVNDLPVMIHSGYGRVPYGRDPGLYLYFLDDNVWLPERAGIWVAGRACTARHP
jgi:hypothetical protein